MGDACSTCDGVGSVRVRGKNPVPLFDETTGNIILPAGEAAR